MVAVMRLIGAVAAGVALSTCLHTVEARETHETHQPAAAAKAAPQPTPAPQPKPQATPAAVQATPQKTQTKQTASPVAPLSEASWAVGGVTPEQLVHRIGDTWIWLADLGQEAFLRSSSGWLVQVVGGIDQHVPATTPTDGEGDHYLRYTHTLMAIAIGLLMIPALKYGFLRTIHELFRQKEQEELEELASEATSEPPSARSVATDDDMQSNGATSADEDEAPTPKRKSAARSKPKAKATPKRTATPKRAPTPKAKAGTPRKPSAKKAAGTPSTPASGATPKSTRTRAPRSAARPTAAAAAAASAAA